MTDTLAALKAAILSNVRLYADIEAGRSCMGSPVLAQNVFSGIMRDLDKVLAVAEGLERERDANEIAVRVNMAHASSADANVTSLVEERDRIWAERDALRAANGRLREALFNLAGFVESSDYWKEFDRQAWAQRARAALAQDDAPQGGSE